MRVLICSLLTAMLLTLIGAGWLLSQLYQADKQPALAPEEVLLETLAHNIAQLIDQGALAQTQLDARLDVELIPAHELPLPAPLLAQLQQGETLILEGESGRRLYFDLPHSGQLLSLGVPESAPTANNALWYTLAFYGVVVMVIGLWLWPLLVRLTKLRAVSQSFGRGELSSRLQPSAWSYISDIEKAFDTMANDIQRLLDDNRTLSRALSHELKTPLARLRLGVDVLSESVDASHQTYISRIDRDLDEMQSLIDALLQYSKLDKANIPLKPQKLDLNALVNQQIHSFDWYEGELSFSTSVARVEVALDAHYFGLVFNNIVVNALKYGAGKVNISLGIAAKHAMVRIEDNGKGIPAEDRSRIFDLFKRHTSTTKAKAGGHGIGLAAVAKACQWLDIELSVSDSESLGGACFTLKIPLNG